MVEIKENTLGISWHDSAWIPSLNPSNVMDYFSERSNPFYDRTCNNELVRMQRLNPEQQLLNMTGIEYILLHVQEPILYVIRKQHRHSPTQVTPLSDYYIVAGVVYQAPDLGSVLNSRILSALHHLQSAFSESHGYSHYHPSKGYWWEFSKEHEAAKAKLKEAKSTKKNAPLSQPKETEAGSQFQRQRVEILLAEVTKQFMPRLAQPQHQVHETTSNTVVAPSASTTNTEQTQSAQGPSLTANQANEANLQSDVKPNMDKMDQGGMMTQIRGNTPVGLSASNFPEGDISIKQEPKMEDSKFGMSMGVAGIGPMKHGYHGMPRTEV